MEVIIANIQNALIRRILGVFFAGFLHVWSAFRLVFDKF